MVRTFKDGCTKDNKFKKISKKNMKTIYDGIILFWVRYLHEIQLSYLSDFFFKEKKKKGPFPVYKDCSTCQQQHCMTD